MLNKNKGLIFVIFTIVLTLFASCDDKNANPASDFEYVIEPKQIIIKEYIGETADVVIPKEIAGKKVTEIGTSFRGMSWVTSIVIPDSITTLDKFAFQKCMSLQKITIPNSVTAIGEAVFYGCSSLTNIIIPKGVTGIGDLAFRDCISLTDITIPDSVTSIGYGAFIGCDLLPDNIKNKIVQINPDAMGN